MGAKEKSSLLEILLKDSHIMHWSALYQAGFVMSVTEHSGESRNTPKKLFSWLTSSTKVAWLQFWRTKKSNF